MRSRGWQISLACLALLGCDRVFGIGDPYEDARASSDADADGDMADARVDYRKAITIAQPTAMVLSGFPVSILETSDGDLVAHVLDSTGKDIGFVDATNNSLPCEIVAYDAGTGALDAWVLPPDLPAAPATVTIHLVYGMAGTRCTVSPWTASHVGVWHAGLAGNSTLDGTTHHHDLAALVVPSGVPAPDNGIVGAALKYDGVNDSLCSGADADGSLAFGTSSFSYSVWIDTIAVADGSSPLERGGGSSIPGFGFVFGVSGVWRAVQNDNAHSSPLAETLIGNDLGRWINLVAVVDRSAGIVRTYADGIAGGTASLSGYGSMTATAALCASPPSQLFHGTVDEMRVYNGALSPEWVNAAWANLQNRSAMITIGPER